MTDYNDGEWHRWDCECEPKGIHPLSQIETIYHDEKGLLIQLLGKYASNSG